MSGEQAIATSAGTRGQAILSMEMIQDAAMRTARHVASVVGSIRGRSIRLYGIPRGGVPAAFAVATALERTDIGAEVVDYAGDADVLVDDLVDSGATRHRYKERWPSKPFVALFDKTIRPQDKKQWLVFPWEIAQGESDKSATDIIIRLFQYIGEDPAREGLKETPARVLRAWREWASGYTEDPAAVIKTFEDGATGYDEMVIVHNIPVVSKCEHHLADIIGMAHVGYLPGKRIVGLSKIARLVEVFARRLQVQERITVQIADALMDGLKARGVGVIIRAAHHCMSTRGVRIHGSVTTTSAMRGMLLTKDGARKEFLDLCAMAETRLGG